MKFSHSLKFNAVPEWRAFYIDYSKLKKLSYAIEKREEQERQTIDLVGRLSTDRRSALDRRWSIDRRSSIDAEQALLATADSLALPANQSLEKAREEFQECLEGELNKVVKFYLSKEAELRPIVEMMHARIESMERQHASRSGGTLQEFWDQKRDSDEVRDLERQLTELHVQLSDLKRFVSMNREGFRKTLKKHDKVTEGELTPLFMARVERMLSVSEEQRTQQLLAAVIALHAKLACGGNVAQSEADLSGNLRDVVNYDRGTVWREMVALERGRVNVHVESRQARAKAAPQRRRHVLMLAAALAVFFVLLNVEVMPNRAQNNCLAMVALLSILWCTEALPLYVTSMLVPLLTVMLRVLPDADGDRKTSPDAAKRVFEVMFSQVIMLLLGGFAIAGALSKHYIAKALATNVLASVGKRPRDVVLANMFVATFASMFISNVAAPVLCFSLVQPILRRQAHDHPLSKCLVMGIAMASNVGGMTSPISSPQNIFAIELMSEDGNPPNWLSWFMVALPVAIVSNLLIWWLLLAIYKPGLAIREVRPLRASTDAISSTQVVVVVVSCVTVVLWCANTALSGYVGNQGIVAILPLVVFFGTGILEKDDFNSFLWHVVMLAQGGLVLGNAVKECGVLSVAAHAISDATAGMTTWSVMAIFATLVLLCTTFVSHTVGAMVILPVVQSVGQSLPVPHPRLLVMSSALMCSGAMGLPVSGFPNMNAVALEDATGQTYVNTADFLKAGLASSVIAWVVIVTLGYATMWALGY